MGKIINFFENKEQLRKNNQQTLSNNIEEKNIEIAKLKNNISQLELRLKISTEELKEYKDAYRLLEK